MVIYEYNWAHVCFLGIARFEKMVEMLLLGQLKAHGAVA